MFKFSPKLAEKTKEALSSVFPITFIVLLLCFLIVPVPSGKMLGFIFGAILLVIGMGAFMLGAEMAMTPIGHHVGSTMTKSHNLLLVIVGSFIVGFIITMAEPDLTVLATQVPNVPNLVLILSVACGVGLYLVVALLRILFKIPLSYMLVVFYAAVFILSCFVPNDFVAIAFDSGGVTTGPMTVPFIMALGVGVASIRSDADAHKDSFGLVSLCSIGPIFAVMILGMLYKPQAAEEMTETIVSMNNSREIFSAFGTALPEYLKEVFISLFPIMIFFAFFQILSLKLPPRTVLKIIMGIIYTFIGLVLFLVGVNIGFMPVGTYLGEQIAGLSYKEIIIPIGMLIGYFIVEAEPAVHVLTAQVNELSDGSIPPRAMSLSLSIGVSISLGLAMLRVLYGFSIYYILIPGYLIAIILTFFSPKIFTSIAFDSGGVVSGPMTATFLLPFALGASKAIGGNAVSDAFGLVAMVAMTPLITIQILGIYYKLKKRAKTAQNIAEIMADDEIIDI